MCRQDANYWNIHAWLERSFGKAKCCENEQCEKKSSRYTWAKKKGFEYIKNRDAFMELCYRCHNDYDRPAGGKERIGKEAAKFWEKEKQKNKRQNAKITKEDALHILIMLNKGFSAIEISKRYSVTRRAVYCIKYGETWSDVYQNFKNNILCVRS